MSRATGDAVGRRDDSTLWRCNLDRADGGRDVAERMQHGSRRAPERNGAICRILQHPALRREQLPARLRT